VYALASVALSHELSYSFFSIMRYTPRLSQNWRWYTSLELFTRFGKVGHAASVQRLRVGFSRAGYQFGLGINLLAVDTTYTLADVNPGIFLRKAF